MDNLTTILSIIASIFSVIAALFSITSFQKVNKLESKMNGQGQATSGRDSYVSDSGNSIEGNSDRNIRNYGDSAINNTGDGAKFNVKR